MNKSFLYFNLILLAFCSCSDEFSSDQIADNYSLATLNCPELKIEDEYQNAQISYFADGRIEIDLGSITGKLEGNIVDDEIEMQAYQGFSLSGDELNLPTGTGNFHLEGRENIDFKTVHINFHTIENRINICTLILNKF